MRMQQLGTAGHSRVCGNMRGDELHILLSFAAGGPSVGSGRRAERDERRTRE